MAAAFCARCGNRLVINGAGVAACPRCEASSFASAPGVSGGPASYPAPNQMVGGGPGALPPPPLPPGYQAAPRAAGGGSVNADEIRKRALQAVDYGKRASLNWLTQARKAMAKDVRDIPVSGAEAEQLATRGITDLAVQRHFVWRRSLLAFIVVPTIFTAVFGSINNFSGGLENLSAFGVIMMLLYTASLWAIPACSLLAALKWDRPAASRRILLIGFLAAFLMIIVLGLLPFGWWLKFDAPDDPEARKLVAQSIALIGGLVMMMQMLPPVLSLLPGAIRACVRIKVLFPESIVSGWLLITVAPLYALFLLTIFIAVNQVAGSFLLIFGVAALVAAPVTYLFRTPLFIRPLWTDGDRAEVTRAQWIYLGALMGAGALLLIYALTGKFLGQPLVGSEGSALIGGGTFSWHVIKFLADYIGRSLFISAIAMDYFLLINVSVWQNTQSFAKTEHAVEYEKTIGQLGEALNETGGAGVAGVDARPMQVEGRE